MRRIRPLLLPLACAGGIAMLGASDLMAMFEFVDTEGATVERQTGGERHNYALLFLAVSALAFLGLRLASGRRGPAVGVAVAGGLGLAIVLLFDIPRIGTTGELGDINGGGLVISEATAAVGMWVALVGAAITCLTGLAFASGEEEPPRPDDAASEGDEGPDEESREEPSRPQRPTAGRDRRTGVGGRGEPRATPGRRRTR